MKRVAYLDDPHVGDFLDWAAPLVVGTRPFRHRWCSPKWGPWDCETLFDAFRKYEWRFRIDVPGRGECRGGSYADTVLVLDELSQQLRHSYERKDVDGFLKAAVAVVHWGGVRQNERRLRALGDDALPKLTAAARLLDPAVADLRCLSDIRPMNSGFSKLYSLLVDGFPIYDSRVACALASLVRLFCEETGRAEVPVSLAFGIPPSQGKVNRNPSCECLVFPRIWWSERGPRRYAESNVMAAWLLDALSAQPPFSDEWEPQRALQSAMFMIGYAIPALLEQDAGA